MLDGGGSTGAHGTEAVGEKRERNHVGKTPRQVNWYDRSYRESHNFEGVEMVQMVQMRLYYGGPKQSPGSSGFIFQTPWSSDMHHCSVRL